MAFRPHRDTLGVASPGVAQALGVGMALEGGKDFARERGSHRPQCTRWRDDESRASPVLQYVVKKPGPGVRRFDSGGSRQRFECDLLKACRARPRSTLTPFRWMTCNGLSSSFWSA